MNESHKFLVEREKNLEEGEFSIFYLDGAFIIFWLDSENVSPQFEGCTKCRDDYRRALWYVGALIEAFEELVEFADMLIAYIRE